MDRDAFEAALSRDGYQIVTNTMEPNKVNMEHAHSFDARLLIVAGAMTIVRDGYPTQTYGVGETFEMPHGCRHSETAGPEGVSYVVGRRQAAG